MNNNCPSDLMQVLPDVSAPAVSCWSAVHVVQSQFEHAKETHSASPDRLQRVAQAPLGYDRVTSLHNISPNRSARVEQNPTPMLSKEMVNQRWIMLSQQTKKLLHKLFKDQQ